MLGGEGARERGERVRGTEGRERESAFYGGEGDEIRVLP